MRCIAISPILMQPAAMLAQKLGANITAARKAKPTPDGKGWSLEKLAAKIEPPTSYQQLSRLEAGERPLTPEWIERIAKALEMDPMDLLVTDRVNTDPQPIRLDEQVATEAARSLAAAALGEPDPDWGTVQAVSLVLRELLVLFSSHPEAASDVRVARPALTLAGTRYAHEAH